MELFIIPLFIWIVKLFIGVVKFMFRAVCYILGCISLGIDMARNRAIQNKQIKRQQAITDLKMQIAQAKAEEREKERMERLAMQRKREERAEIKFQWEIQKEADRRAELAYKREQREKQNRGRDRLKKQLAKDDLDYLDQSMQDITPLVDKYRETFETTVTDKTREQAYKKLYQLEARQHRLDKARQKAIHQLSEE